MSNTTFTTGGTFTAKSYEMWVKYCGLTRNFTQ